MFLHLKPIGHIEEEILADLKEALGSIFSLTVEIDSPMEIPSGAYDPGRDQYEASVILVEMMGSLPDGESKVLGIIDRDIYVPQLNFIFGLASSRTAIISITRLREEYYGLPANEELFKERFVKEAVHEIGHMFGLKHCANRNCVMHFSNSLEDTDIKDRRFCNKCRSLL